MLLTLQMLNAIAYLATFALTICTSIYILKFSSELIRSMNRKNLETNLTFLFANLALLVLLAFLIKQTLGGL